MYLPQRIEKKFYLSGLEFQDRRGMYGYAYARWYDGIVYAYGSSDTIYIQMSGTGCRTWETTHLGLTWDSDMLLAIYLRFAAHKPLGYCLRYLRQVEAQNRTSLHPRRAVYLPLENLPDPGG